MKTGLVLEGGAMRGMYTAGVLDVFLDEGIRADGVVGVSAGALFGVSYVSGQRGRSLRYSKKYNKDPRYMGIGSLLRTGNIVNAEFAYQTMPHKLDPFDDQAFMSSGIDFYAVITNLQTGRPEYVKIEHGFEQMDVLRASGSMPFVSRPVKLNGNLYLDGGVSDPIPYRWMRHMGYDRLVIILTRDITYRKKPMSPVLIDACYGIRYRRFAESMKHWHRQYNRRVEQLNRIEEKGKVFIIRPSEPIGIKRLEKDPKKLQQVYELGLTDVGRLMPQLRRYLQL